VTEYFKGHNWKVHPDFVYCEYNSLKDMDKELESSGESYFRDREDSFDTPEEQVMHFMARAGRPGWKWMSVSESFSILFHISECKTFKKNCSFVRDRHSHIMHIRCLVACQVILLIKLQSIKMLEKPSHISAIEI
jgi:hypothetical protein